MSLKNLIDNASFFQMKLETAVPASSYATNAAGFTWGAITFNQWIMGITLILGILTFVVNFYFQCKRNSRDKAKERREMELHKAELEKLRKP